MDLDIPLELTCHRDTPTSADAISIGAKIDLNSDNMLTVTFVVTGDAHNICFPRQTSLARRDGLWKHTCFEVFARLKDGGYCEFNFSPSGEWAAYRFSGYREGMTNLEGPAPSIAVISLDDPPFMLVAAVDISALRPYLSGSLAISAVIEEHDGKKSYWALKHPLGQPDFHHKDCFALQLSPPETI